MVPFLSSRRNFQFIAVVLVLPAIWTEQHNPVEISKVLMDSFSGSVGLSWASSAETLRRVS
jgi:hypothetical protein